MKLTKDQINKITELYKSGKANTQIALELKIPITTVSYYLSNNRKKQIKRAVEYFRNLPTEKKKLIYANRKEYYKQWYNKTGKEYMRKYMQKRRCKNLTEKQ